MLRTAVAKAVAAYRTIAGNSLQFDQLKINQGRIHTAINRDRASTNLQDYEFKVFSQWGEDGILQKLVNSVPIANKTFLEFGVEDFSESICRFLMMSNNWSGYVIDGSSANLDRLVASYYYCRYDLRCQAAFVTVDNIDALLRQSGFDADVGVMSIDLDGVDYHVLEAISYYRPRILVTEYNAVFGDERRITVPYDPAFDRTAKHSSNLYWGASLGAIAFVAAKKGYSLVGTTSEGLNAFFVRDDVMTDRLRALSVAEAYTESRFRESRDADGRLTYLRGGDRLAAIRGMPVIDVTTGAVEPL